MILSKRRVQIGIAIGSDRLSMVAARGDVVRTWSLELDVAADPADSLPSAFANAYAQLEPVFGDGIVHASIAVALLPPLAGMRLLQLPPLREAEAEAVVRRDAGRYFVAVPAPHVVGVRVSKSGGAAAVTAAAAAGPLVEAVRTAAAGVGWRCRAVAPAHAAWIAAAGTSASAVIAIHDGIAHVIHLDRGTAVSLRRVPGHAFAEIVDAAPEQPGSIAVFAESADRSAISGRLQAAGWAIAGPAAASEAAAAAHAHAATLALVPATAMAERRGVQRRTARRLAVAAVVLLAGSAALELWGAQRELDAVRGRRAEIRARVAPLLQLRDSIGSIEVRAAEIRDIARTAPHWTPAIFDLAMLLPPESHVTRLYAVGDTLIVDAEGDRAGAALQALRGAAALDDVRLVGGVDRELADGSTAVERFRIRASLRRPVGETQ